MILVDNPTVSRKVLRSHHITYHTVILFPKLSLSHSNIATVGYKYIGYNARRLRADWTGPTLAALCRRSVEEDHRTTIYTLSTHYLHYLQTIYTIL